MKASKRKYALVGEMVRIVTRRQFIRCGYPLCGDDVRGKMKERYENLHGALTTACREAVVGLGEMNNGFVSGKVDADIFHQCDKLAVSIILNREHFGGKQRRVIEQDIESSLRTDGNWEVLDRKMVKTGDRVPGGKSGYYGEDYDPPYLSGEENHCIYELQSIKYGTFLKIDAVNTERVDAN